MAEDDGRARDEEGRLARWSRRKAEARRREPDPPPQPAPESPDEIAETPPTDLPDPATLGPGADFKPYLRPGVPARLRTAALRRLWRSNPVLANLDGLVDYGEDFTDAARVGDRLQTAYQVGRGFARKLEGEPAPAPAPAPDEADPAGEADDAPLAEGNGTKGQPCDDERS